MQKGLKICMHLLLNQWGDRFYFWSPGRAIGGGATSL